MRVSVEPLQSTLTHFQKGRYRYLRGPQGFKASGDAYTKLYYDMTVDIPRKTQCVDDTLLWDNTIAESFWHIVDYMNHNCNQGIVFNSSKFKFSCKELDFAGFTLTDDGMKPSKSLLDAIASFKTPKSLTDARS